MLATSAHAVPNYRIEAIERGLRVLRLFTPARHNLSLKEIAGGADCVPSTALRIVMTLCDLGFLQELPGRGLYRPGIAAMRLGVAALLSSPLHRVALPAMRKLHESTQETVNLDVLLDGAICHVERFKQKDILPTAVGIGSLFPAYCTAPGKLFMALLPPAERAGVLRMQSLVPITSRTITSKAALQREFSSIREQDFAFADCEMWDDLRAISAPVRGQGGRTVAAVTLVGSTERLSTARMRRELVREVTAAAASVTRELANAGMREQRRRGPDREVALPPAAPSRYHITALARGLALLDLIARREEGAKLTEIAATTGWSVATAFRVATTLCELGYLEQCQSSGRYGLTYTCLLLGYCATFNLELSEVAQPDLRRLHEETGESVFLSVLAGAESIATVQLLRSERFGPLGDRFPAHVTANGKVLLAHLPKAEREVLVGGIKWVSFTPKTLTSARQVAKALAEVRAQGFAVTDDELAPGTRGVAAPVFDRAGACVASISLVCSNNRLTLSEILERYRTKLCRAAERISLQLRYRYPHSEDAAGPLTNGLLHIEQNKDQRQ